MILKDSLKNIRGYWELTYIFLGSFGSCLSELFDGVFDVTSSLRILWLDCWIVLFATLSVILPKC